MGEDDDGVNKPDKITNTEEENLVQKRVKNCIEAAKSLSDSLREKHPNKKHFLMRIGDRKEESGYREIEIGVNDNNELSIQVGIVNVDLENGEISKSIEVSISEEGAAETFYVSAREDEKRNGFTMKFLASGVTIRNVGKSMSQEKIDPEIFNQYVAGDEVADTDTENPVTSYQIYAAIEETRNLINEFKTKSEDEYDEFITNEKPPTTLALGGKDEREDDDRRSSAHNN